MTSTRSPPSPAPPAGEPPRAVLAGAQLRPAEVEAEYRRHFLKEDRRALGAIVLVFGVLMALFAFSDPPLVADPGQLRWLWPLRGVGLAAALILAWAASHARTRSVVDVVGLLWVLVGVLLAVAIQSTRPRGYFLPAVQDAVFLLVVWTILPVRFAVQVADAAIVTGGTVTYLAAFRDPPAQGVSLVVAVTLAGVNLLGGWVAYRSHRFRRRLFLAIREKESALHRLRQSEEPLRASERRLRLVARNFPDGSIALFDERDRVLLADGSILFLGLEPGALQGRAPAEFAPPELARQMTEALARARTGEIVRVENRIGTRLVETQVSPALDEGRPSGHCVMVSQDVTRRRQTEANLALAARLASLGTLVAGVSHEINNPLAGALASVSMARESVEGLATRLLQGAPIDRDDLATRVADLEELLEDASMGAERIARIVKDMALFGSPDPERKRVRLHDVVDAAMRWLPPAVSRSSTIRVENHGPPDVIASAGQLEQVLVNLVANADKAARPGKGCHITIGLGTAAPGVAYVEVRDDGVGMTPEVQSRIFDPFFTTREVGQGMGIGLPVCHSIVTAHGGTITVASAPGEGATFRVELPAAAA